MRTAHILRNNLFFYFLLIGLPSISTCAMVTAWSKGADAFASEHYNVPVPIKGTYIWKHCNSYSYIHKKCMVWKFCIKIEKDGSCTRSVRCDREKCINNTDRTLSRTSPKKNLHNVDK